MSRSQRHTPIYAITTARSEAPDKRFWHKRMRASERGRLHHALTELEAHLTTLEVEVSNCWTMSKDGHRWWGWREQAQSIADQYALDGSMEVVETLSLRCRAAARYKGK